MKPSRIFWRFASGGQHNSLKGVVRSATRTKVVARQSPEHRERVVAAQARKTAQAKKTAASKPVRYAAAKQIAERNRAAAKATAAAQPAKKTAATKVRRKPNGQLNGREAMNPGDRRLYDQAMRGGTPEHMQPRRIWR
jgi:hypothetical protein